jgi:ribosomal protein L40E
MKSEKIEEMVEKLAPKVCYNCGERNPQDYEFCLNCKLPLDIESIKTGEKRFLLPIIQKMIDRRMEERRIKKVG